MRVFTLGIWFTIYEWPIPRWRTTFVVIELNSMLIHTLKRWTNFQMEQTHFNEFENPEQMLYSFIVFNSKFNLFSWQWLPLGYRLHNVLISDQRVIQLTRCVLNWSKNHLYRLSDSFLISWRKKNLPFLWSCSIGQSNPTNVIPIRKIDNKIDDVENWLPKQIHKRLNMIKPNIHGRYIHNQL